MTPLRREVTLEPPAPLPQKQVDLMPIEEQANRVLRRTYNKWGPEVFMKVLLPLLAEAGFAESNEVRQPAPMQVPVTKGKDGVGDRDELPSYCINTEHNRKGYAHEGVIVVYDDEPLRDWIVAAINDSLRKEAA